jgi:hypothetical protein
VRILMTKYIPDLNHCYHYQWPFNDKMFDIPFAKTLLNLSRMILSTLPGTFFNKFSQCLTTEIDSHKDLSLIF